MHDERLFSLHDAGLGGPGLFLPLLIMLAVVGRAYYTKELQPYTVKILLSGLLSTVVIGGILLLGVVQGVGTPGKGQALPSVGMLVLITVVFALCFSVLSIGYYVVQRQRDTEPASFRVKLQKFSALFGLVMVALGISRGLWFTGICFGLTGLLLLTDMLAKTELVLDFRFFRQVGIFLAGSFVLWMLFWPPGYVISPALRIEFPTIQDWPMGLVFGVLFAVGFPIQVFLALNKSSAQEFASSMPANDDDQLEDGDAPEAPAQ